MPPQLAVNLLLSITICNVSICFACMYVLYRVHIWCLQRLEKGIGSPRTEVIEGCGLTCGCWELNRSHQQERQVPSTAEPSVQPQ